MELRLLRYFLTVAKEQSFTKAAEQLHITQPTLSRQMAAFEEELGVILFIRSGKKISLTEEGILLKRRALEIHNLEEKTLEELKGKEDLIGKPLILPERVNVQSELANWFGKDFSKLQIAFTSNLGTNAGVMAANGLGYPVSIEGAAKYWREDILVQRRISPEITTSTVIAWRRNIPYSLAVRKMIEEINTFQA